MRNRFIELLIEYVKKNKKTYLITGDLGYSVLEPFKERFPDNFINAGIAEQNMMGLAAGLAMEGNKVFVYSIVNFLTFRALEQIRNDICYHNLDVNLISIGAGYSYGAQGYTHHGIEDIGIMRVLPNMQIYTPYNLNSLEYIFQKSLQKNEPKYFRLGRGVAQNEKKNIIKSDFVILNTLSKNNIVVYGEIALEIKKIIVEFNLNIGLIVLLTPFNKNSSKKILSILERSQNLITIEEHIYNNGLGSYINYLAIKKDIKNIKIKNLYCRHKFISKIGDRNYLLSLNGISGKKLADVLKNFK